jgi:alkylation response protein AidB-like acyl-CoA dehydrogenase
MTGHSMTGHSCCAPHPANAARVSIDEVTPADRTAHPHRRGSATKADLLVIGSLITMDGTAPNAEAMAVAGGRILAVGSRSDLEGFVGTGTKVLEHNAGRLTAEVAASAKLLASELQGRLMDACVQMHGGYGYMNEYPIARLYTDARVGRIYGGSNEVMKELIARTMDGGKR